MVAESNRRPSTAPPTPRNLQQIDAWVFFRKVFIVSVAFWIVTLIFVSMFALTHEWPDYIQFHVRTVKAIGKIIFMEYASASALRSINEHFTSVDKVLGHNFAETFIFDVDDSKGKILDQAFKLAKPSLAVQIGAFTGHHAIRFAKNLPDGAKLYTCDPHLITHALTENIVKLLNLQDKVTVFRGHSHNLLRKLFLDGKKIDFLFIDHIQHDPQVLAEEDYQYPDSAHVQDYCLAEQLGLLADNATVIGDNVRLEGMTGDFRYIMQSHPSYDTVVLNSATPFRPAMNYETLLGYDLNYKSSQDSHENIFFGSDELKFERDEFTISVRRSQDWGWYREEGNQDYTPGYPEGVTRGHYYYHPNEQTFINELGRTPEDQDFIDRIMHQPIDNTHHYVDDEYLSQHSIGDLYDNVHNLAEDWMDEIILDNPDLLDGIFDELRSHNQDAKPHSRKEGGWYVDDNSTYVGDGYWFDEKEGEYFFYDADEGQYYWDHGYTGVKREESTADLGHIEEVDVEDLRSVLNKDEFETLRDDLLLHGAKLYYDSKNGEYFWNENPFHDSISHFDLDIDQIASEDWIDMILQDDFGMYDEIEIGDDHNDNHNHNNHHSDDNDKNNHENLDKPLLHFDL